MAERSITLPSGAEIVVRGMKISEANKLASRTEEKPAAGSPAPSSTTNHVFNDLLRMCTVSVVNPGPCYTETDVTKFWDQALVADRFHALIQIRCTSYPGRLYTFKFQCEQRDSGGCGQGFEVGLNLEKDGNDIKYADLPAESRTIYRNGNRFDVKVAGKVVTFGLMTGADEGRAANYLKKYPQWPVSASLLSRIVEIGPDVESLDYLSWLNDLDMSDFLILRDAMEAVDGGIDTTLELPCPHCGHINFDVSLPFGRAFLMPASRR